MMTFLVNHDGVVYEKDLGPETDAKAKAMTVFDLDAQTVKVPDQDEEPIEGEPETADAD